MSVSSKRLTRFLKRLLIISLAGILFLLALSTILFYYYKDDIAKAILLQTNSIQKGEITFNDISFNPFHQFPDVALKLDSARLYEKTGEYSYPDSLLIIDLESLFLTFDILDLLQGDINMSRIELVNGNLNLIKYSDSSLNISNALSLKSDSLQIKPDTIIDEFQEFELNLDRITLKNIDISYHDSITSAHHSFVIPKLHASFNYLPDTVKSSLNANLIINNAGLTKLVVLRNKNLHLTTSFSYARNARRLFVQPSQFMFEKSNFNIEGLVNLSDSAFVDLKISGDDRDFSMLDVFLTSEGIENIKKGNMFFEGTIKGVLFKGIPVVDCSFGMNGVDIRIPNTGESISQLSLNGSVNSGHKKDLSGLRLEIKKLNANLPGGKLNGKATVSDLTALAISLDLYLKSRVDGFDNIFDLGKIDSLKGSLEVKSNLTGTLDLSTGFFIEDADRTIIRFDSVSFNIPGLNLVKHLNGRLSSEGDTITFKDLDLHYGTSDFRINGDLVKAIDAVFGVEKDIFTDLHIQSATYDFSDFFSWDPKTATSFPYRIKDIDLYVQARTSTQAFKDFLIVPKIVFDIEHLDAEIEDFLPPVSIKTGVFTLADADSSLHLNFDRFDIDMVGSNLKTKLDYYSPWTDPDRLRIDLDISGLNPKDAFVHWFSDSIDDFLDGSMDASLHLDLVISLDSLTQFDKLDFVAKHMDYTSAHDTFDISMIKFNATDISYEYEESSGFVKTLSMKSNLSAKEFNTNHFWITDTDNDVDVETGVFEITLNNSHFFDQKGEGFFILKPFESPPSYQVKYSVSQFDVAKLFNTFQEDTVLTGKMDLDMNMSLAGSNWKEISRQLDGHIRLNGKDLTFHGMDLDKVIDRFKRSQRFTFADLGAVLLMGPAGILVTKGSDYASILVLNHGESSHVLELSSDWDFDNGKVSLTDVAFTTKKNRMAAKGIIDIPSDTLSVQVGLLNPEGCSIFSQGISGKLEEPDLGKVKVVKSLLAPVTNLANQVGGVDCEVFYNGSVKHPEK